MRKHAFSAKRLFDVPNEKPKKHTTDTQKQAVIIQPTTEQPKKKRGRPKKVVTEEPQKEVVKEKPSKKEKQQTVKEHKNNTKCNTDNITGWKDFNTSKPELLVPVEFMIDNGKEKKITFTGYISEPGVTCTNEPYKLVILRKKYGNLYYREINGCSNVEFCPNRFPECAKYLQSCINYTRFI